MSLNKSTNVVHLTESRHYAYGMLFILDRDVNLLCPYGTYQATTIIVVRHKRYHRPFRSPIWFSSFRLY
ncbi:hypothetical protein M404DRAFT_493551 [Pisolithus tinctorius Marx 270]|uniref:Uncharacterized protein n=1 Tax=Pisolithus tinctorius Marx 270 TaxID=870435 RepID=A0A0C3K903_PISTI|nr:hypothetical protein M404DRAFT_493551 [Pisolithus tinctorius Marx 270]